MCHMLITSMLDWTTGTRQAGSNGLMLHVPRVKICLPLSCKSPGIQLDPLHTFTDFIMKIQTLHKGSLYLHIITNEGNLSDF